MFTQPNDSSLERRPPLRRWSVGVFALALVMFLAADGRAEGPHEEPPILLQAADAVADDLLEGPHHRIKSGVENDGYMNNYTIESEFGTFTAEGNMKLRMRLMELDAIAQLKEVTRTQAFTDSVSRSATKQVRRVEQWVDEPVETAKGIPGGVSRLVKRTSRQVKDLSAQGKEEYAEYKEEKAEKKAAEAEREAAAAAGEPVPEPEPSASKSEQSKELAKKGGEAGEKYAKKWSGYAGARRRWAKELGVDPYSDNEVLNKELYRVAQASAAGTLTMKLVPVPRIGVLGDLGDVASLVWDMDPMDLRLQNEKQLYEMGISEEQVLAMYENAYQTPSLTAFLVASLARLEGVEGRELFVQRAAEADSRTSAEFVVRGANFLAEYHTGNRPLSRLGAWVYSLPQAVADDGRLVTVVPVDRLHWTKELDSVLGERLGSAREATGAEALELWIEGGCSDRALEELKARGFEVYPRSFSGMQVSFGS